MFEMSVDIDVHIVPELSECVRLHLETGARSIEELVGERIVT